MTLYTSLFHQPINEYRLSFGGVLPYTQWFLGMPFHEKNIDTFATSNR